jgi:hypothetical protein
MLGIVLYIHTILHIYRESSIKVNVLLCQGRLWRFESALSRLDYVFDCQFIGDYYKQYSVNCFTIILYTCP